MHGVGGTIGALLTGVFANSDLISSHPASKVLIEEGRFALIFGQLEAVLVAYGLSAFGTILIALTLQKSGINFRVSSDDESKGLDIIEHGEESYQ